MRRIRDCNVAVIGGAGFLGSHLVDHLIEDRGCKVVVVDNLISGRREFVHKDARFEHADIVDSESYLLRLFKGHGIDYVFNYAAWPYIPDSFARPVHVFQTNATGALHVINAAQEAGCEGILQVSSAEIYGSAGENHIAFFNPDHDDGIKLDETAPVIPHSSYGAAKAAIDSMCQVRWREAKTPCIALRQFNVVGPRETHPYVVPEIISQLSKQMVHVTDAPPDGHGTKVLKGPEPGSRWEPDRFDGKAVIKLGNNSFRDFQYAGDAVRMAVELLERGQFGEVYNMGSESGVKIYDLAKMIGKVMGFADVQVEQDPARVRPWEIWHLQSDNTKLYQAMGLKRWEPLTPLEEALKKTVDWYVGNGRKWPWESA